MLTYVNRYEQEQSERYYLNSIQQNMNGPLPYTGYCK